MAQDHFQSFQEADRGLRGFFYDCLLHLLPILIDKKEVIKIDKDNSVIIYSIGMRGNFEHSNITKL